MVLPGLVPAVVEGCSLLYHTVAGSTSDCCRSCAIEIRNHNRSLEFRRPEYHLYSGVNQIPPEPIVAPGDKACCTFRKVSNSTYGTAGVVTYGIHHIQTAQKPEIEPTAAIPDADKPEMEPAAAAIPDADDDESTKLVLMWSVPFFGSTYHAVGIERNPTVNEDLFQKLYYGSEKWFQRDVSGIGVKYEDTVHGCPISVIASISNTGQATWTIDIE